MKLGDKFTSFCDFEITFNEYKKTNFVDFSIKDCKTILSQKKRYPKLTNCSEDLKYYYVKFSCVHGGTYKKMKSCQEQRNTSTMRQGCKAFIYLIINDTGDALEITKINTSHNHEVSEILFNHLPNQRKISPQDETEVLEMMELKANKKLIQHKMQIKKGKIITLKDTSNDVYMPGKSNSVSNSSLNEIILQLRKTHNCTVEKSIDSANNMIGLYIQDKIMKNSFNAFPEVVFADATYKLNNLRILLYILMVEDGNGMSEIAALGLMANEDQETLKWFFKTFQKYNTRCQDIQLFMTDKNLTGRSVIKDVFPHISLSIYLFNSIRSFNREITCEKLIISPEQRDRVKSIIQKMCYAKSEAEYNSLFEHLQSTAPKSTLEYFIKNWHNIRQEWVIGLTFIGGHFLNNTNNRLESINGKLKSVIPVFLNINDFVEKLFVVIKCVRLERHKNAVKLIQKKPTMICQDSHLNEYFLLLTPYAFAFIKEQSESLADPKLSTTILECQCRFFLAMKLPCRHIFKKRINSDIALFDEKLCDQRWTRRYYYDNQRVFQVSRKISDNSKLEINQNDLLSQIVEQLGFAKNKKLSAHDNYCLMSLIGRKFGDLVNLFQVHCERKIEQLIFLFNAWSKRNEISLKMIDQRFPVHNVKEHESFHCNSSIDDHKYSKSDGGSVTKDALPFNEIIQPSEAIKMKEERLIEQVRIHSNLYDKNSTHYKDHNVWNETWEEIGQNMEMPADKCRTEWTKLRNCFLNVIRRNKKSSGQAAKRIAPWKYIQQMEFLLPHIDGPRTLTNVLSTENSQLNNSYEQSSNFSDKSDEDLEEELHSLDFASFSDQADTRMSSLEVSSGTLSEQNIKYVTPKENNSDLATETIAIMQEDCNFHKEEYEKKTLNRYDDIDSFYLNMAKVAKRLSKIDEAKLRIKVCRTVSEAEINHLNYETHSSAS